MNRSKLYFFIVAFLLFLACNRDDQPDPVDSDEKIFSNFSFLRKDNAGLTNEIYLDLFEQKFYGSVPHEARIHELIASFELKDGCTAYVDGEMQTSGTSENDFTQIITYSIVKEDGEVEEFEVDVKKFTGLPIVYIDTEGSKSINSKEDYINASVSVYGGREFEDIDRRDVLIRGRGNSTWYLHPKKPYQMKFQAKVTMLGMPQDRKWLFLAEYSDKTFLRNRVAFELGYLSNLEWTPQSKYAEVFLNGQYQGTYHLTQKVEETSNRVDVGDEGFLLEIDQLDRLDDDDVYFYSDHFLLCIKEPELAHNSSQYNFIRFFIDDFETALFGNNFKNPVVGYRKYIDVESMVDWYLINEIAKNVDARWFASIFMYLIPGEKMKMGPIWDFDLGFGNVNYADAEFPEGYWVRQNPWINRMFQDPAFVALVKERFVHCRSKESHIYEMIDEQVEVLYHAQWENDKRWSTLGTWVWPNSQVFNTYQEEVDFLKEWISRRMNWLDSALAKL